MNPSTRLALATIDALLRAGVREVVLAPGSRNAPLGFAAFDAARAGRLRLHTRIDERSAAFLALGMAKVGPPAAVICTSGTAVANLHPALLEAAHSGVALIALTADRPARLRGTSSNQTTDQVGIFGPLLATQDLAWHDEVAADLGSALAEISGAASGPRHLNLRFDEPLLPDAEFAGDFTPAADVVATTTRGPGNPTTITRGPRTVVIAGDDAGPPARVLAQDANWPLLAEPTSGSRTGANAIRTYRLLLESDLGTRIERAIVVGHPTLSRPVTRLLQRDDVQVWSAPSAGVWSRRPFDVAGEIAPPFAVDGADDPAWLQEWLAADASVGRQLDALLAAHGESGELAPHAVAGAVSRALPPGGLLYLGASSPIRDLDLMVASYAVGDRRKVVANRGLAGIDGTVSSAIGAALARDHGTRNLALLGDVTFLHDTNGLVLGPREARPDLTLVVVNDDGGAIFAMLEQGAAAYADRYDTLFGTPHGVDLEALCAATATPHRRVVTLADLEAALAQPRGGIEVVEVVVRRDNRRALDAQIRAIRP